MKIAIVEDNQTDKDKLLKYLKKIETSSDEIFDIITFQDGLDIVTNYPEGVDLIYFDVQMPHMDGMTAAKKIRAKDANVIIVFLTNYVQYAIDGYQVNASDFLLKPLSYFSLAEHFKKVRELIKLRETSITVNSTDGLKKIILNRLYYVESEAHYLHLHLYDGKETIIDMFESMKNMEKLLSDKGFFRCNNCYIVNLKHVDGVKASMVQVGPYNLTISRPRKKAFMQALTAYLGMGV
ncbi:LytR/AlgR family response regulator transcription factor [Lactobacillus psittaci]|uniref:Response regulator protein n=1 Tax=Lactobacillus psittaci DSM 15354 TaxID=1122152 RepID=A0A0R1S1S7_9LACO|nr:LytTR family DNA-binding domain-containing protein [Lactobacillus psittaci]KRL63117.1 response regulator protein [Lactobacillus psittaci DSM 15354]